MWQTGIIGINSIAIALDGFWYWDIRLYSAKCFTDNGFLVKGFIAYDDDMLTTWIVKDSRKSIADVRNFNERKVWRRKKERWKRAGGILKWR